MSATDALSQASEEPAPFVVRGELRVGTARAGGGTVALHRVSAPFTGVIDSVSVGPAGRFELRLPGIAEPGTDVFFASVRYDGVLYFGDPISGPLPPDSVYVVRAYPGVPAGTVPPPEVGVRNLILESAGPDQGWNVTDVFQVENKGEGTIVSSEYGAAWSHALPAGAAGFRAGAGDLPAASATFARGRVEVSEPVRPGASVWAFHYQMPSGDFEVPLEGVTGSMEVLVRAGSAVGGVDGLAPAGDAELQGRLYRRFAGRGLAPANIRIRAQAPAAGLSGARLAAALAALVLAVAGTAAAFRPLARKGAGANRRALLVAVAELDEAAGAGRVGADEHRRRRRALLERLNA